MANLEKYRDTGADQSRINWGQYLMNTALEIPEEYFLAWQRETFDISVKYLPQRPAAARSNLHRAASADMEAPLQPQPLPQPQPPFLPQLGTINPQTLLSMLVQLQLQLPHSQC